MMLHVVLADGRNGWVIMSMITVDGDTSTLPLLDMMNPSADATSEPAQKLAPMQAFYFKTGLNDAPCSEAPDSGILIQTPEGAGKIELMVNNAKVTLGSTGYFQAQPSGDMTISIVEGQGTVESSGVTVTVPAGTRTTVPLDAELNVSGPPTDAQPYDISSLQALPITILPKQISIAPPLEVTPETSFAGNPVPGTWTYTSGAAVAGAGCPAMLTQAFANAGPGFQNDSVVIPEGEFSLQAMYEANSAESTAGMTFVDEGSGVYKMVIPTDEGDVSYNFRVTSPTHIEGETIIDVEGCTITIPFTMTPAS